MSRAASLGNRSCTFTGATGYVGSLVLEQLLRCCPKAGPVYVMVRAKGGLTAHTRILKLLNGPLFAVCRDMQGLSELEKRVQVVTGDILLAGCGLSAEDALQLRQRVTHVVHSAASIKFEEPALDSLCINFQVCCSTVHKVGHA